MKTVEYEHKINISLGGVLVVYNHNGKVLDVQIGDVFQSPKGKRYEIIFIAKDSFGHTKFLTKAFEDNSFRIKLMVIADLMNLCKLNDSTVAEDEIDEIIRKSLINHALDTRNEQLFNKQFEE